MSATLITVSGKVPLGNFIGLSVFLQFVEAMEITIIQIAVKIELINPDFFMRTRLRNVSRQIYQYNLYKNEKPGGRPVLRR
jgi:hypothetical protein